MNDQFFACIDNCGVTNPTPTLRHATPVDLPAIVGLIRELAAYEKLEYLVVATPESMHPHLFRRGTGARHAAQSHRRLTQGESPSCSALLGPTFGCPSVSDAMFRDDWQDGVMKHEATTARLDVLEAAVLALADSGSSSELELLSRRRCHRTWGVDAADANGGFAGACSRVRSAGIDPEETYAFLISLPRSRRSYPARPK